MASGRRWGALVTLASALSLAVACTTDDDVSPDGGVVPTAAIAFDVPGGILATEPNAIVKVSLTATGGVRTIALALDGAYGDGSLDRTTASIVDGHAEFMLRTPTTPATFAVQASAGSARARLDVSVSKDGFATVRVTPAYKGKRPVPIVAASTFLKARCSDITEFPAKDGAPLVVGTSGETLVIPKVPAGSSVAVAVRVARYAIGCVDVDALAPDAVRDVTVGVYDVPLSVSSIDLQARFTFDLTTQDRAALSSTLASASSLALGSFFPDLEPKRLLDAMADATSSPTDKSLFATKRSQAGWDASAASWLTAHPPTMQTRATSWLTAAIPTVPGDLHGHLTGTGSDKATFVPETLGGLDATTVTLIKSPFTVVADTDDTLKLTGNVIVWPSRLLALAANVEAAATFPPATSVPAALAIAIDCTGFGAALASNGYAFGTCDGVCVAALCKKAIADRWEVAAGTSEKLASKLDLQFTASAGTQFDDLAVPVSYTGSWLGQLGPNLPAKGTATGIPYPK